MKTNMNPVPFATLARVSLNEHPSSVWSFVWEIQPFWVNLWDIGSEEYARSLASVLANPREVHEPTWLDFE